MRQTLQNKGCGRLGTNGAVTLSDSGFAPGCRWLILLGFSERRGIGRNWAALACRSCGDHPGEKTAVHACHARNPPRRERHRGARPVPASVIHRRSVPPRRLQAHDYLDKPANPRVM